MSKSEIINVVVTHPTFMKGKPLEVGKKLELEKNDALQLIGAGKARQLLEKEVKKDEDKNLVQSDPLFSLLSEKTNKELQEILEQFKVEVTGRENKKGLIELVIANKTKDDLKAWLESAQKEVEEQLQGQE